MAAPPELLSRALPEYGDILRRLLAARTMVETAYREELADRPVSPVAGAFLKHLRAMLGQCSHEKLHSTFVDRHHGYLADEIVADGDITAVGLQARQLLKRSVELGAHGIILAHNHPSGSSEPSEADVRSTRSLAELMRQMDVHLIDHLVVGRNSITSMREGGYL